MKKYIMSVYDTASLCHSTPFFVNRMEIAERDFKHACTDPASPISKCPGDYSLHCLGVFHDDTGEIVPDRALFMSGSKPE